MTTTIHRLPLFLLLLLIPLSAISGMAATPQEPYKLIIEAITKGDIERAFYWINTVEKDFPGTKEAELAGYLRLPLCSAEAYGRAVVCAAYLKSATRGNKDAKFYAGLSGPHWMGVIMVSWVSKLLGGYSNDRSYPFGLVAPNIDESRWHASESELEFISIGIKSTKDTTALSRDMALKFLGASISLFKSLEGTDKTKRAELFIDLARCLKMSSDSVAIDDITKQVFGKQRPEMLNVSLECVDMALDLTKDNPYTNIRADADELKSKIESALKELNA